MNVSGIDHTEGATLSGEILIAEGQCTSCKIGHGAINVPVRVPSEPSLHRRLQCFRLQIVLRNLPTPLQYQSIYRHRPESKSCRLQQWLVRFRTFPFCRSPKQFYLLNPDRRTVYHFAGVQKCVPRRKSVFAVPNQIPYALIEKVWLLRIVPFAVSWQFVSWLFRLYNRRNKRPDSPAK